MKPPLLLQNKSKLGEMFVNIFFQIFLSKKCVCIWKIEFRDRLYSVSNFQPRFQGLFSLSPLSLRTREAEKRDPGNEVVKFSGCGHLE